MAALNYLKLYQSEKTVALYKFGLKRFFKSVYHVEVDNGKLEKLADRYLSEKEERDHKADVEAFFITIKDAPPLTSRVNLTSVKMFMLQNGIDLQDQFWKSLKKKIKGSRSLTMDRPPTVPELKKIINELPTRGKAFYLLLASSGMRIGEVLQLQPNDLELDKSPARVNLRGEYTKTGNSRLTFMSSEARESLVEWLKQRDTYMKTAISRSRAYTKDPSDTRVFPWTPTVSYSLFDSALKKAGLCDKDTSTNREKIHPHTFRKFFRTHLGGVIPPDVVEALMGHEEGLTEVYRRYSTEDLEEFYKKGEHSLMVFSNGQDIAKLKGEVEEKSKTLNEGMATLALKNADLENRMTALISEKKTSEDVNKKFLEGLNERIARLEKIIEQLKP